MYVPMRNLIQCMGDMALMPKICEKYPILGVYFMIFVILSLGHSIMCSPRRIPIHCMDIMAVMAKMC